jgi:hypothetical protein
MRNLTKYFPCLALGVGLSMVAAGPVPVTAAPYFQEYGDLSPLRGLVDRTQSDLRGSGELEHGNQKERERYHNAQRSLSTFDRHLTKGHFDKDELDRAIDDLKNVLDHNTLQASSRDALLHDIEDLRAAREHRYH